MLPFLRPSVRSRSLARLAFGLVTVALFLVLSGPSTYGQSTDLNGEFTTYNGQIAQADGVIDVNGTAVGRGRASVVVAFVGQRGNTEAFKVTVGAAAAARAEPDFWDRQPLVADLSPVRDRGCPHRSLGVPTSWSNRRSIIGSRIRFRF